MILLVAFCPIGDTTRAFIQRHVEEAYAQPVVWRERQVAPSGRAWNGGSWMHGLCSKSWPAKLVGNVTGCLAW